MKSQVQTRVCLCPQTSCHFAEELTVPDKHLSMLLLFPLFIYDYHFTISLFTVSHKGWYCGTPLFFFVPQHHFLIFKFMLQKKHCFTTLWKSSSLIHDVCHIPLMHSSTLNIYPRRNATSIYPIH